MEVRRVDLANWALRTSRMRVSCVTMEMLKREWCAESNGKLPHLFIPSKTATLVPEFAVEDLPLDRTVTLVPAFAVNEKPLSRTL